MKRKKKTRKIAKYDGKELLYPSCVLRLIFSRKTTFITSVSEEEHLAGYKS